MDALFENATLDGDYDIVKSSGNGASVVQLFGVWDEATVIIKGSLDGETFTEPPDLQGRFSANTLVGLFFSAGDIRATIINAGENTNLTGYIEPG